LGILILYACIGIHLYAVEKRFVSYVKLSPLLSTVVVHGCIQLICSAYIIAC